MRECKPGVQIEQEITTIIESDVVDDPKPDSGSCNVILWCLRIVITVQCVGVAGRYLFSPNECESDVFGYLFFDAGWPEKLAQLIDDVGAYGCVVSAIVLIVAGLVSLTPSAIQPPPKSGWVSRYLEYAALVFIATWAFFLAAAHMIRGEVYAEFALAEQAVRFVTPLAMVLLLRYSINSSVILVRAATIGLTLAVVATFAVHGYIAQELYGPFVDLILLSDMRLFKFGIEQSTAETFLEFIGWADIVVAALLLLTRWRMIAAYMMIWGLITAASRLTAFGFVAWPESLIRIANAGAPLVLLLLYQKLRPKKANRQ